MFEAVLGRKARSEANKQFIDMEAGCMGQCSSRFPNKRFTEKDTFSSIEFWLDQQRKLYKIFGFTGESIPVDSPL